MISEYVTNPWSQRPIRIYRHDEMSGLVVHGEAFDRPFADPGMKARRWRVAHARTMRHIRWLCRLPFGAACEAARVVEACHDGWGQYSEAPGGGVPIGMADDLVRAELRLSVLRALEPMARAGRLSQLPPDCYDIEIAVAIKALMQAQGVA